MKFRLGTWDPLVDLSRAEQKGRLVDLLRVLCLRNGSSIVLFPHGYQSAAPVYLRGLQALIGPFRATDYWCCRSRRNLVSSLRGMFLNFTVLFLLVFKTCCTYRCLSCISFCSFILASAFNRSLELDRGVG